MSTSAPRSLSEWLRAQPDEALAALLQARPDLAVPAPGDVGALANRAGVRFSVIRALEDVDAFTLQVLDGVLVLDPPGPADLPGLTALLPAAPVDAVRAAVDRLRARAVLWGPDHALHVTGTVREVVGPYPAALGRPAAVLCGAASTGQLVPVLAALGLPELEQPAAGLAVADVLADRSRLSALLAACGDQEHAVLRQLSGGPPLGTIRDALRPVSAQAADSPVRWLLAHGLLVAIDPDTVELPREVGLALRAGAPLGPLQLQPSRLDTTPGDQHNIDAAGAGQVLSTLRLVEAMLETFAAEPPTELRAGGVGVRDLRRVARAVDLDEPRAAQYLEVARAAGLLDSSGGPEPVWLPTSKYDDWLGQPAARRWVHLGRAWLQMTRLPALVGQRDERGRPVAALSAEVERPGAAGTRRRVLGVLAELPAAAAVSAPAQVAQRLAWQAPRRAGQRTDTVVALLAEAEALGVTGRTALTSYGRLLLAGDDPTGTLADRLPDPVSHVLVQADLTVVAPGPLEPELARELTLVADVESAGAATVYRISEASVRRALDAGRAAAELHELFGRRSRTPVPQALTYLIDDVARRHGTLRVGSAMAYLRCDDEVLLAQVLADRRVDALRLRRVAPTVLTSRAAVGRVLESLRQAGYAPMAESADGAVMLARPDARRAPDRAPLRRGYVEPAVPTAEQLTEVVRAIRAGDRALHESRRVVTTSRDATLPNVPGVTTAATLSLLRDAARDGRAVWLGYVNAQGAASHRIVEPISVSGGYLRGYDHRRDEMRTFALHRITAVALLDPDGATPG